MERLFRLAQFEFSNKKLAQCDREVARLWSRFSDDHNQAELSPAVPAAHFLWRFETNPNAHAAPTDCYAGKEHGTRNAYWMAFTGAPISAAKSEL